jgi:hypothetical protein
MSNRAFLSKSSGELFEAINTMPVFWLHLLDKNLIAKTENEVINYYKRNVDDDDDERIIIKIPKKTFIQNLNSGEKFVRENHNSKIELYNNFINYLDKEFNENDILELDITEIIWFFDDAGSFISAVKNYKFRADETIYSYVGYSCVDGGDNFGNYSKDYAEYAAKEEKERELIKNKDKKQIKIEKIKSAIENIFLCIVGIAFVVGSIFVIIKTGIIFMGIVIIIFGIISLSVGILKLKKIIWK